MASCQRSAALAEYTASTTFQDIMQAKVQSILVDSDKINEVDRAEWLAEFGAYQSNGFVEQEEAGARRTSSMLSF